MNTNETTFETWMDADLGGDSTLMTRSFNLEGAIPLSLLVDADGRMVDRWRGYKDEAFWRAKVRALIGSKQ